MNNVSSMGPRAVFKRHHKRHQIYERKAHDEKKKSLSERERQCLTPARLKKRASLGLDANSPIWHVGISVRGRTEHVKNTLGFHSKMRAAGAQKLTHIYGKPAVAASGCDSKTRVGCSQARFKALAAPKAHAQR